ncbi:unnamed protein product [Haemonchus placei]|uniref:Pept_C1 domain-containing protein n=1 Tax=Haemonchus placei TaxID=6290 RepID=A0A158QPF8_HAEPC|nr:unnamed protein product [Haemonchus placei]
MLVLLVFLAFFVSTQAALTAGEFAARPISKEARELTGKALVDYVNDNQPFFKAEYSAEVAQRRLGSLMRKEFLKDPIQKKIIANAEKPIINDGIPESFDARTKWKECPSITHIRDQSNCGSCWAVSAAETMSDRLCIHSNGTIKMNIMKNGPVQAAFTVYEDFAYYKKGVYVVISAFSVERTTAASNRKFLLEISEGG